MNYISQDLRHAWRSLIKNPALSFTIVITLTLAIGTNTAVFTVLNEVLSKSLPFPEPEKIVNIVQEPFPTINEKNYRDFVDVMKSSSMFESVGVFGGVVFSLNNGTAPARVFGLNVKSEMLKVFKIQPELGRFFRADEEHATSPIPIILNYSCWKKQFGGDHNVLNKIVRIDGESAVIIGVMPKSVEKFFWRFDIWLPFHALAGNRPQRSLFLISRLNHGTTVEAAGAFVKTVTKHMSLPQGSTISLVRMSDRTYEFQKDSVPVLKLWMGIAVFILIIACANAVNLLLARGSRKEKEIAIRTSLGATRMQVIRLMLFESFMLALLGGIGGLIFAFWARDIFGEITFIENATFNVRVVAFAFLISLFSGLIAGFFPALQLSRTDLSTSLKQEGRSLAGGIRGQKVRGALVIAEISLAVVLLTGAGLLIKGLILLMTMDPGFQTHGIVTIEVPLSMNKYPDRQQRLAFYEQCLERARQEPQVKFAALTDNFPLLGSQDWNVRLEASTTGWKSVTYQVVSADYFRLLGLQVQGRSFDSSDRKDSTRVAVINESFAKQFWPAENALGRKFLFEQEEDRPVTVIGVVKDIPQSGLDQKIRPLSYLSFVQEPSFVLGLIARGRASTGPFISLLQKHIWAMDRDQPADPAVTLDQSISDSLSDRRIKTFLLLSLGTVGFVISMIGIFAMMSYSVACRKQEIGVRMALGAQRKDVVKMITRQGAMLAIAGLLIGVTAAIMLTRFLASMIYGVTPTDPATFITVCIFFFAAALIASYFPARRASAIDPVITLRHE